MNKQAWHLACILILAATDLGGIAGPIGELDLDWFTGLVRSADHGGASCLGKRGYKSCFSTFAQLADGDLGTAIVRFENKE